MSMFLVFEYVRVLVVLFVLGYAAYCDYKTGVVSNNVWKVGFVLFPCTFIGYVVIMPSLVLFAFVSFCVSVGLAFWLFYGAKLIKQVWGGADSKALIFVGCGLPLTPLLWWGSFLSFAPLLALFFGSILALWTGVLGRKRYLRFLPFLWVGLVLACLI